uniref:Uncharacterized protein n=1 Tax=Fagus sylvatica TaxID=28930 RepID=A0A2N9G2U5_FAGSY
MPAVTATEPRGATTPGLEVEEEDDWDCDVPLAIIAQLPNREENRYIHEGIQACPVFFKNFRNVNRCKFNPLEF